MVTADEAAAWRGHTLIDREGKRVGTIVDIYLDSETDRPEWVLVNTGLLGTKQTFVPLDGASMHDEDVRVEYEKSRIKDAPSIEPGAELTPEEEETLYHHYQLQRQGPPDAGRAPSADDVAEIQPEAALGMATAAGQGRRSRLRKHVVIEEVTITVPVRREEIRLVPEAPADGAEPAGQGQVVERREVVLHEEASSTTSRVVAERVVPLEDDALSEDDQPPT